jgi:hypothetical protein
MNDILQLKGSFQQRPHDGKPGPRNLPKGSAEIKDENLQQLLSDLEEISKYWANVKLIKGCLIDVYYKDVVAKSNRITGFLSGTSKDLINTIVGARFSNDIEKKHIITHYVSKEILDSTIENLRSSLEILNKHFHNLINQESITKVDDMKIDFDHFGISKTLFCNIIVDSYYIEGFKIPDNSANTANNSIITLYEVNMDIIKLLGEIGIEIKPEKILSGTTLLLYPDQITLLTEKAPYLIAMATEDISKLSFEDIAGTRNEQDLATIPSPTNEPTVGVIDTMFDDRVYFHEWVDFKKTINPEIPLENKDYEHGTAVTSIIVDGPTIHPELEDNCGRFKVRHFGVSTSREYSSFSIMKSIKQIVETNPDIRVWNLSLGSANEINPNFISPEAAVLDKLQFEKDVIFIVAGTNKCQTDPQNAEKMIGAPADSINSMVVNAVNSQGEAASYSRKGLVLSFFNKPDICSFGGDTSDYIKVCTPLGVVETSGTSYAAPWITRKIAYLIEVLGLSREIAKAMVIDAATGWDSTGNKSIKAPIIGHGIVPKDIREITQSRDDEIKFVISGVSENWDTYTYNLPVPVYKGKHPFVAKATLCYFPRCSMNQGVDYTNTELDLYFGRINGNKIMSINKNMQSINDGQKHYIYEGNARKLYRKWDNVKHINEMFTDKVRARAAYGQGFWGISVKTKERLNEKYGNGIKFGLVVTLKEIDGVNRLSNFIQQCELRGWLVNKIDVNNRIEIYNKAQERITFET